MARRAGLPDAVVHRARAILAELEAGRREPTSAPAGAGMREQQLSLVLGPVGDEAASLEVAREIRALEPSETTPMQALEALARWHARLEGEA